jgi:hypothetical protein
MNNEEIENFKKKFNCWVDSIISYDNSCRLKNDFGTKIDLLERVIQLARFHIGENENQLKYSDFSRFNIEFGNDKIIFLPPSELDSEDPFKVLVEPHKPRELQIPLAIFLLVNNGKCVPIYKIIESFVEEIRPSLIPLDFDKTQTGVVRCFTNTRFAASGLRDQGLLKFTKKEAFRTWELSFIGILVAGFLYYDNWRNINFDIKKGPARRDPCGMIYDAIQLIGNLPKDDFVKMLALLCDKAKSGEDFFDSSRDKLNSVPPLIKRYAYAACEMKDGLQKRKRITEILDEIEKIPGIEKFVSDFRVEHEMVDFNKKVTDFLLGFRKS